MAKTNLRKASKDTRPVGKSKARPHPGGRVFTARRFVDLAAAYFEAPN